MLLVPDTVFAAAGYSYNFHQRPSMKFLNLLLQQRPLPMVYDKLVRIVKTCVFLPYKDATQ